MVPPVGDTFFFSRQEQGEDVEEKEDEKPVESPKKTEKNEVNSASCYKVGPEPSYKWSEMGPLSGRKEILAAWPFFSPRKKWEL